MFRVALAVLVIGVGSAVGSGPVDAADERLADISPHNQAGCEPVLPLLDVSVPAGHTGDPSATCEVIASPSVWSSYCARYGLTCDDLDAEFFDEWTVVAVLVETMSPVICENAGPVPGWGAGCVRVLPRGVSVRVAETHAGHECSCSMMPQYPIRRHLVQAIPATTVVDCRSWRELHRVECLAP